MWLSHKKRAQVSLATKPLIGLILAALIIGFTLFFFGKMYGMVLGGNDDKGVGKRFDALVEASKDVLAQEENYAYDTIPFFLAEDYVLIGFNDRWDDRKEVLRCEKKSGWFQSGFTEKPVKKPEQFGRDAALCLYERGKYENPIRCKRLPEADKIVAPTEAPSLTEHSNYGVVQEVDYDEAVKNLWPETYEVFALYGKCGHFKYEVDSLYIEKYEADATYLFIGTLSQDVQNRRRELQNKISRSHTQEVKSLAVQVRNCFLDGSKDESECDKKKLEVTESGINGGEVVEWLNKNGGQPVSGIDWDTAVAWELRDTDPEKKYFMKYVPAGELGNTYPYVRVGYSFD